MSLVFYGISQFCEFEWFEWVMFWVKTAPYPNDHFKLGRYHGLIIDIGPALMAKIIKENGQVFLTNTRRMGMGRVEVHSWSPYTRGFVLRLRWETGCKGYATVWSIWGQLKEYQNISHVGWRARGSPRVGEPLCECRNIAPKRRTIWPETKLYVWSMMPMATQFVDPIRTLFWMYASLR